VDIWAKNQEDKILIAGPCVAVSFSECLLIGKQIKESAEKYGFRPVFKASFDKANRTSSDSFRGLGLSKVLDIFRALKEEINIQIVTDVHETKQIEHILPFVDYLQIPAFLSRQTDLIIECAYSGLPTLIKKGQFLSPESCYHIENKYYEAGGHDLMIGERGNTFGYNDLIVDATSISRLKKTCTRSKIIMDCTHSLQKPNGIYGKTEGRSDLIEDMVKFASIMDSDGLFIETHPNPSESPSDSENMLSLDKLDSILELSRKIYNL
jgi:2-dehydro-3-deoxyphosphooctonate aldolase (KDO 8-P synthase)